MENQSVRPSRRRAYPPTTPAAFDGLREYLRRGLADPAAPEPADRCLLIDIPHGPIIEADFIEGEPLPAIALTVAGHKPRPHTPDQFLILRLLLAFGGGMAVADSGTGMGYLRLFRGDDRIETGRLWTNARVGEVVKQHHADYHDNRPEGFSLTTAEAVREEGKKIRTPYRGRPEAIETACRYYEDNHHRSGIKVTLSEYRALLEDAFKLFDERQRHRALKVAAE